MPEVNPNRNTEKYQRYDQPQDHFEGGAKHGDPLSHFGAGARSSIYFRGKG